MKSKIEITSCFRSLFLYDLIKCLVCKYTADTVDMAVMSLSVGSGGAEVALCCSVLQVAFKEAKWTMTALVTTLNIMEETLIILRMECTPTSMDFQGTRLKNTTFISFQLIGMLINDWMLMFHPLKTHSQMATIRCMTTTSIIAPECLRILLTNRLFPLMLKKSQFAAETFKYRGQAPLTDHMIPILTETLLTYMTHQPFYGFGNKRD